MTDPETFLKEPSGYPGAADRCGSLWLRTDLVDVAGMSLKGLLFLDNLR
jgi:hypothetical protein